MPAGRIRPKHFPEGIFISFVALAINIATTFVGVVVPDDAKIAKPLVYYVLLGVCLFIFISYLVAKYCFLCCTCNIKPSFADILSEQGRMEGLAGKSAYCQWSFCHKSMLYDVAFCTMALFYLTGDNLQQNVCEEDCGPCPIIGHAFTGASLVINIALTVVKAGELKPKLPSAIPVIGKLGNVYSTLLQIAATALTIDLTYTSILDPLDIEKASCNATIDSKTVKDAAIGIMTVLCVIILFILLTILGRLACINGGCCDNEQEGVEKKELFMQWLCAICVMGFVILFIVGDVDWFWNFFISKEDTWTTPRIIRLVALSVAFLACGILMFTYFFVICLPGMSVAMRDEDFFLPKNVGNKLEVVQHMAQKGYNAWDAIGSAEVTKGDGTVKGSITVNDQFDKASITLDVNEEIKCWNALCQLPSRFMTWEPKKGDLNDKTNWTVNVCISKDETNSSNAGTGKRQAAHGASAPSSNEERIELPQRHRDTSIRDTSDSGHSASAVSGPP